MRLCAWQDGSVGTGNWTDSVEPRDVGLILLAVMGALDFVMIAVALLTAFNTRSVIAKFHYTGPTGPARTRTDFVGDPHEPNGVSRRPGPQKSPCGSGRVRVVEFSLSPTKCADFVWSGPVRSGPVGPCSGI